MVYINVDVLTLNASPLTMIQAIYQDIQPTGEVTNVIDIAPRIQSFLPQSFVGNGNTLRAKVGIKGRALGDSRVGLRFTRIELKPKYFFSSPSIARALPALRVNIPARLAERLEKMFVSAEETINANLPAEWREKAEEAIEEFRSNIPNITNSVKDFASNVQTDIQAMLPSQGEVKKWADKVNDTLAANLPNDTYAQLKDVAVNITSEMRSVQRDASSAMNSSLPQEMAANVTNTATEAMDAAAPASSGEGEGYGLGDWKTKAAEADLTDESPSAPEPEVSSGRPIAAKKWTSASSMKATTPGFFDVLYLDDDMLIIQQNEPGGIFISTRAVFMN